MEKYLQEEVIIIKKSENISFYTHFIGFLLFLIGTIYLIYKTKTLRLNIVSIIYGASTMLLFLASSLYHANKKEDDEISLWRKLDHIAIFIMIAGTYTPITYVYLSGYWKWSIIIIQWSLVVGGLFFKFFYLNAPRYLYTVIYLLMGWMGIVPIKEFISTMSDMSLIFMFGGGLAYTIGAVFYIIKKPQFKINFGFHEIFHIFILIGAILHYLLVYYALVL